MEPPIIDGITIRSEIGSGATGTVYDARGRNGEDCVVKVLDSIASNPALLENRIARLQNVGAQDVTVQIRAYALNVRPACLVMSLMAERLEMVGGVERYRPHNLQIFFADYCQTDKAWPFLIKLANRLATMHKAKVAHGNLKPGNIFLGPKGGPLLADFASGMMPGVHHLGYSDALLYSPPEQLRNPEGYLEEAGYQWDVYAFGVLAYRLLTGRFPRCHDTLSPFSPAPGTEERFHVDSDRESIAAWLETDPDVTWQSEAEDERELRRWEMVNFCLGLDAMGRPSDMREVARYFESIERDFIVEAEQKRRRIDCNKAHRRRRKSRNLAILITLVAIGLGAMWEITVQKNKVILDKRKAEFNQYRDTTTSTISNLESVRDETQDSLDSVLERGKTLQKSLANEQSQSQAEIISAQETSEHLFRWILEKGVKGYPVLEGRKERLSLLAKKIQEQLEGMDARPELKSQAATLRLRYAEIILAKGDVKLGEAALQSALETEGLPRACKARANLRLLLLKSARDEKNIDDDIVSASAAIRSAWPEGGKERIRAETALDLVRARNAEANNDGKSALVFYLKCLKGYRDLTKLSPENQALAMTLGRTYLAAAATAEGAGATEDVAKLRGEAAKEFLKLIAKQEKPDPDLEYQIASATAARAVALWQEGKSFEAEKLAKEGVKKLSTLLAKMPGNPGVIFDLSSQNGILATFLRDEGKPAEAGKLLEASIISLQSVVTKEPEDWNARYLIASLKWQHAGILGQQGKKDEELKLGAAAHDELTALLKSGVKRPNPGTVRKSLAYLCGDLAHSADLANKRDLAIGYLRKAQECWKLLKADEGDQLEFREGHQWAVDRLVELGVK
jgi:serine/threonine protein kinase